MTYSWQELTNKNTNKNSNSNTNTKEYSWQDLTSESYLKKQEELANKLDNLQIDMSKDLPAPPGRHYINNKFVDLGVKPTPTVTPTPTNTVMPTPMKISTPIPPVPTSVPYGDDEPLRTGFKPVTAVTPTPTPTPMQTPVSSVTKSTGDPLADLINAPLSEKLKMTPEITNSPPLLTSNDLDQPSLYKKALNALDTVKDKVGAVLHSAGTTVTRPISRFATRVLYNDWTSDFSKTPDEAKPYDVLSKDEEDNITKYVIANRKPGDTPDTILKQVDKIKKQVKQEKLAEGENRELQSFLDKGPGYKAEEDTLFNTPMGKITTKGMGETLGNLGEMTAITALTGNPFLAGFTTGALDSYGKGGSAEDILKEGIKSGTFNFVGGKAGKYAGKAAEKLIQASPLKNTIVGNLAAKLASGTAFGTAGTATEFITSDEKPTAKDFFQNALVASLFEVVPAALNAPKLSEFSKSKVFEGMKDYEQEMKQNYYEAKMTKDPDIAMGKYDSMIKRNDDVIKGLESNSFPGASKEVNQAKDTVNMLNDLLRKERAGIVSPKDFETPSMLSEKGVTESVNPSESVKTESTQPVNKSLVEQPKTNTQFSESTLGKLQDLLKNKKLSSNVADKLNTILATSQNKPDKNLVELPKAKTNAETHVEVLKGKPTEFDDTIISKAQDLFDKKEWSVNSIQRNLKLGYASASRLKDLIESKNQASQSQNPTPVEVPKTEPATEEPKSTPSFNPGDKLTLKNFGEVTVEKSDDKETTIIKADGRKLGIGNKTLNQLLVEQPKTETKPAEQPSAAETPKPTVAEKKPKPRKLSTEDYINSIKGKFVKSYSGEEDYIKDVTVDNNGHYTYEVVDTKTGDSRHHSTNIKPENVYDTSVNGYKPNEENTNKEAGEHSKEAKSHFETDILSKDPEVRETAIRNEIEKIVVSKYPNLKEFIKNSPENKELIIDDLKKNVRKAVTEIMMKHFDAMNHHKYGWNFFNDDGYIKVKADRIYDKYSKLKDESGNESESAIEDSGNKQELESSTNNDTIKEKAAYVQIAEQVKTSLENGEKLSSQSLYKMAIDAYKGGMAEGKFNSKDAFDAMELGVNKYLESQNKIDLTTRDTETVKKNVEELFNVINLLPTQGRSRTDEMIKLQQFSTPPPIAYTVSWLADISKNDIALEPSAGIGGIAVFAKINGAKVVINEYDKRRLEIIKEMGFDENFNENAEQLNNILPGNIKPTVVIMNPPFSSSVNAVRNSTKNATLHIEQALKRLEPNGRLVAIVGRGMAENTPTFMDWWKKIKQEYNVRANVGLSGENYTKYGTTFDDQILVIDKDGPTVDTVTDNFKTLPELIDKLEAIANDRPAIESNQKTEQQSIERTGEENTSGSGRGEIVPDTSNAPGGRESGNRKPKAEGQNTPGAVKNPERGTGNSVQNTDEGIRGESDNSLVNEGEKPKGEVKESGSDNGGQHSDVLQSGGRSDLQSTGQSGELELEKVKKAKADTENIDKIFENYKPEKVKIKGSKPHPTPLVQSAAMAAVEPPGPTYKPSLPKEPIESGFISDAQLEAIVYAGQAHEAMLPNGKRQGYFCGDGTGVGKSHEIAGIILDNFNKGRRKAIWISKNKDLLVDSKKVWAGMGQSKDQVFLLNDFKDKINLSEGICFLPYTTLKMGISVDPRDYSYMPKPGEIARVQQIVDWVGKDFDGVLAFDEAHLAGNLLSDNPSDIAMSMQAISEALPNARVLYFTATGATEIQNFGYISRLGLWGQGTEFRDVNDFVAKIEEGGLAAMECVARDLKAMGLYCSRTLSMDGVEYEKLIHELTPVQDEMYSRACRAWQVIIQNIEEALELTGMGKNGNAKGRVNSQFWSGQQRFFNQFTVSLSMPTVLADMKKELEAGHSPVIQIVDTNEADQNRKLAQLKGEGGNVEDLELTPLESIIDLVKKVFPVQEYQEVQTVGPDGKVKKTYVPVLDSNGKPVENREAVQKRDNLIADLKEISLPDSPIDMILKTFGVENVAEITGRKRRVVWKTDPKTGKRTRVETTRSDKAILQEVDDFQDGKRKILIFSNKGGTGKSYHADKNAKNQGRRIHYILQAGFNAANAIQGIGRDHRSNQVSAPLVKVVGSNIMGSMRFTSTIARRMSQLGAITKGQRDAGSGVYSESDNLETPLAKDTLARFYRKLFERRYPDVDFEDFITKVGLYSKFYNKDGVYNPSIEEARDITRFLNRILVLEPELQNKIFNYYHDAYETAYNEALNDGTLDTGLENYKAEKVVINDEQVIREDSKTGAQTKYISFTATKKNKYMPYSFVESESLYNSFEGLYKISKTGEVVMVSRTFSETKEDGSIVHHHRLRTPDLKDKLWIDSTLEKSAESIPKSQWKKEWNDYVKTLPETYDENIHMITGMIIPVWKKLGSGRNRIMRVITSDGGQFLGRIIPTDQINGVLNRFDITSNAKYDIKESIDKVLDKGYSIKFSDSELEIVRKKVSGENRLELTGKNIFYIADGLKRLGLFAETIQYNRRYFIPTNIETAEKIVNEIVKDNPIIEVVPPNRSKSDKDEADVEAFASGMGTADMPRGNASSTKAKSIDEIIDIIEKEIGVPIKTGKFKNRAEAIFKRHDEVIRTKVTNDLPRITHELGHYFDKKYNITGNIGRTYDKELLPLGRKRSLPSYTVSQIRKEGIAEFLRYYLTNPAKLNAPLFTEFFENHVDVDTLKFLGQIRGMISDVVNLPNNLKILNDISVGESHTSVHGKETGITGKIHRLYDAWLDEFASFTRAEKLAESRGWTGENLDIKAKLYRGLEAKALMNINEEQFDLKGNKVGPSYKEIMEPLSKKEIHKRKENPRQVVNDFRTYMVSRRALDYEAKDFAMPQPYYVYADNVTSMDSKYPYFEKVFNDLRQWEDNNLQLLVESGIKSQTQINNIKKENQNHVPLYRIQEAIDSIVAGSGKSMGASKNVVKKAKGSGKTIIDPIESQIKDAFIMRRAAEANEILNVLADMSEQIDGFGELVEKIPHHMASFSFNVEDIEKRLNDMGIDTDGIDLDELISIFKPLYQGKQNEIMIYRNGKPELYEVDSELYKAIKGLNQQQSHFLIRMLNIPKKTIQAGAVTTIQFILRNMGRDTLTSMINSEVEKGPAGIFGIGPIGVIKGYWSSIMKDQDFKDYIKYGGGTEYIQVNNRYQLQQIEDSVLELSVLDKFFDMITKPNKNNIMRFLYSPFNAIREGISWSELGPRLAEFKAARKQGVDPELAAAMGRDLSQDFARSGYCGKELNKIVAFFNGNLQGNEKFLRTWKDHPFRTLLRGLLYVTLPTMLLWLLNKDDKDYQRLPAWRKALCWNIPIGGGKFVPLPKPFGFGWVFGAIPEFIANGAIGEDNKVKEHITETFAQNFSIPVVPSILSPAVDIFSNKSWTGAPIESTADKRLPPYLRYNEKSSVISKSIADVFKDIPILKDKLQISPKQIDYAVKGYTGSVGEAFWKLPDTIKQGVQMPTDITNLPVIKSFVVDSTFSNDVLNDFYDYGAELNNRKEEADKTGTYRYISGLNKADQTLVSKSLKNARLEYNNIAKDFTAARKAVDRVKGEDSTEKEKEDKLREIQNKMNDKAEKFNKKYETFKNHWGID